MTDADDAAAAHLTSEARLVAVRAAAGCGKTHAAVEAALAIGAKLPPSREVLLLAHTHAAVRVFQARIKSSGARARAMTLDAFIVEIVRRYAGSLSLPSPLRPGLNAPFPVLGETLGDLFRKSPSITRCIALHYPFIIFDEHQDARRDQHSLLRALVHTTRTRVRIFGDPLQAIYGFDGEAVPWAEAEGDADVVVTLNRPRRWMRPGASPSLGNWIAEARRALECGSRLDCARLPPEVALQLLPGLDAPPPKSEVVPLAAQALLFRLLREKKGSLMLLVRNRAHAVGVRRVLSRTLPISERIDGGEAHATLELASQHHGDAREQVRLLLKLLRRSGVGCTREFCANVERALGESAVNFGKQRKLRPFLEVLAPLYEDPTTRGLCRAIARVVRTPPPGIKFDTPGTLRLLSRVCITSEKEHDDALALALRWRSTAHFPSRCTSTVHHAKGEECDHVIVMHCSRGPYPDNEEARKLLYVALSRACRSVTVVASAESPSQLLGIPTGGGTVAPGGRRDGAQVIKSRGKPPP